MAKTNGNTADTVVEQPVEHPAETIDLMEQKRMYTVPYGSKDDDPDIIIIHNGSQYAVHRGATAELPLAIINILERKFELEQKIVIYERKNAIG
jgi:hypothetical protein